MKRIYNIPKIWSVSFNRLTIGLWKWTESNWWGRYRHFNCWHELLTTWQYQYFKCTIYKKIEIQWLHHFYFQIILDKPINTENGCLIKD